MYWLIAIVFIIIIAVVIFSISKALNEFKKIVKEDELHSDELSKNDNREK